MKKEYEKRGSKTKRKYITPTVIDVPLVYPFNSNDFAKLKAGKKLSVSALLNSANYYCRKLKLNYKFRCWIDEEKQTKNIVRTN